MYLLCHFSIYTYFLYEHVFHFSAWFRMTTQLWGRGGGDSEGSGARGGAVNKPRSPVGLCASDFTVYSPVVQFIKGLPIALSVSAVDGTTLLLSIS